MGNVLQAGVGQAPARQALARAPASRKQRRRHHDQQGLRLRHAGRHGRRAALRGGEFELVVAGGMESMSNAPYLLPKGRPGLPHGPRPAHRLDDLRRPLGPVQEHPHGQLRRAVRARSTSSRARRRTRSRSRASSRAQAARTSGQLQRRDRARRRSQRQEGRPGDVDSDEEPLRRRSRAREDGHAQAGLREGRHRHRRERVDDQRRRGGARARRPRRRQAQGAKPLARIVAQASHAQAPEWFTTAPVAADREGCSRRRARRSPTIDLFEVNEAFAVVAMAVITRPRSRPDQGQRQRRRRRPRPPDRRVGRAHPDDAAPCAPRTGRRSAAWPRSASAAAKPPRSRRAL